MPMNTEEKRKRNSEKCKAYHAKNRERCNARRKRNRQAQDKLSAYEYYRNYYLKNRERILKNNRDRYHLNYDKR